MHNMIFTALPMIVYSVFKLKTKMQADKTLQPKNI